MSSLEGRPYRSHKVPACETCRRRKIRCFVDIPSQPCRFCREHARQCTMPSSKDRDANETPDDRPRKRARTRPDPGLRQVYRPNVPRPGQDQFTSPVESSSLMMHPTMAEDINVLETHLTSESHDDAHASQPYHRVSRSSGDSIVYLSIPRWPKGRRILKDAGKAQREIMEQVLHTSKESVVRL